MGYNHTSNNSENSTLKYYLVGIRRDKGFGQKHIYDKLITVEALDETDSISIYRERNKENYNAVEVLCQVPVSLSADIRLRSIEGLYDLITQLAKIGNEFDNLYRNNR